MMMAFTTQELSICVTNGNTKMSHVTIILQYQSSNHDTKCENMHTFLQVEQSIENGASGGLKKKQSHIDCKWQPKMNTYHKGVWEIVLSTKNYLLY